MWLRFRFIVGRDGLHEELRNHRVEYWFGPTGGGDKIADMLRVGNPD